MIRLQTPTHLMNKKTGTVLFILAGTVFNILVTALCFAVVLFVYSRFLFGFFPPAVSAWMVPVNFVFSIAISSLVYRLVIRKIAKKIDLKKYLNPIFNPCNN